MLSLDDFAIQHKEAGIESVIRHVLKYGTTIPEENREKIVNFFVDDCKKRTPRYSDFSTCLKSGCNGLEMMEHIGNLSPHDPHRNVIEAIMRHPADYAPYIKHIISFYPPLRDLMPGVPQH